MRRKQRAGSDELAQELLQEAEVFHLATTTANGAPVLRVLNGVLVRDWILFHGAFAGEKSDCLDRPAVVSAHEVVADIPSHFVDKEKACPATTYYRAAQAHGTLRDVVDGDLKKEMLTALMEKYQPEGGYEPFSSPIYQKDLRSVRVFGVHIEEFSAKVSLGQDRPPERTEKVVRGLWERGKARDLAAIEMILASSPMARPSEWVFSVRGEELFLVVHPTRVDIEQHAALLAGQYWRTRSSDQQIRAAITGSDAWVGVRDSSGTLLGAGRATSDGHWVANIFDVVVREDFRGKGVGRFLMRTLLEHPRVKSAPYQRLGTMDAMAFYEQFGFRPSAEVKRDFSSVAMERVRER